jgi:pSer/pThr/pTyr-binding forkhead associated (FHA) protein
MQKGIEGGQMIRLLVKYKDRTIKELALDRIDTLSIGRNATHHLVLDNYAVSGDHAAILKEGNRYMLKDTNSKNGTFLNGLSVEQAILKHGDVITIGKHTLVFLDRGRPRPHPDQGGLKTSSLPGDPGPDHTMFMDTERYRQMLAESGAIPEIPEIPAFVAFLAGGEGRFDLSKSLVTIGRTRHCDIVINGFLSFLAGDPAAAISKTPQHYYLSSVSGWIKPKVNGQTIRGPVRLKDMDLIKIGTLVLQYTAGRRASS